jgi:hypothetical protein
MHEPRPVAKGLMAEAGSQKRLELASLIDA